MIKVLVSGKQGNCFLKVSRHNDVHDCNFAGAPLLLYTILTW